MSFRELPVRRVAVMGLGILIMGMGVALFKLSLMGNDPNSAMVMAAADRIGMDFSVVLILENSLVFIVELLLGRKYIGLGTFVNWFGVGPSIGCCGASVGCGPAAGCGAGPSGVAMPFNISWLCCAF